MTYYGVTSRYYDTGKVKANLVDIVEADEAPQDSYKSYSRFDCYTDWFDSREKAEDFIKQAAEA